MKNRRIKYAVLIYSMILLGLAVLGYCVGDYALQIGRPAETAEDSGSLKLVYMPLPQMKLSVAAAGGHACSLRMDISLAVEQRNLRVLEGYSPAISNRIMNYVRTIDVDDLRGKNATYHLREQLLSEVNGVNPMHAVRDIVFQKFVVL